MKGKICVPGDLNGARHVLTDVGIWIDGLDFAGVSNSVGVEMAADTPEDTVFASGEWKSFAEGGLKTDTLTLEGFYDTTGPDADIFDSLGNEESAMVIPDGQFPGDVAHIVPIVVSGYTPLSGSVGDLAGMAYAAQGDRMPFRAQVMDVRENVTANTVTTRLNLGAIPAGETLRVWAHVQRNAGQVRIRVRSSATEGGAPTTRATVSNINSTGLVQLTVDGAVTHEWWDLQYTITGASDFDIAAASHFESQQAISTPITPITPPTPATHTLLGGVSADAIPAAGELTIVPNIPDHTITIPVITNMHILFARDSTQGDITSIVDTQDPTSQNQIGGWTKYGSTVTVSGTAYNVWVSDQEITTPSARTFDVR